MPRRTIRALIFGGCALAFYALHFLWFALYGPPAWFSGVGNRGPEFTRVVLDSSFDLALREFEQISPASLGGAVLPPNDGSLGRVVREDRLGPAEPALQQTRQGERDRLYLWSPDTGAWREQPIVEGARLEDARWIRTESGAVILLVRQLPWWPFGRNYTRFWRALLRAELRPERGLSELDPETGSERFLFAGHSPQPSPDRAALAFLRSDGRGYHSLHLWRPATPEPRVAASLWEAEPGAGVSFHCRWSSDSRAILVTGSTRGQPGAIHWIYDVEGDRLVDLGLGSG
jgi:hypothetical protein